MKEYNYDVFTHDCKEWNRMFAAEIYKDGFTIFRYDACRHDAIDVFVVYYCPFCGKRLEDGMVKFDEEKNKKAETEFFKHL